MNADFTPSLDQYKNPQYFRFWCQKVLPLVYDDSLSYYELLCKVVNYLNDVIADSDTMKGNIGKLLTSYNELQEYVNNYFASLDVQNEINNKLDEMAASGALNDILDPVVIQATSDWLLENITPTSPAVDASLTVAGAAADAKSTGDRADHLENEILSTYQNEVVFKTVPGEYINASGQFTKYEGWSRTELLPCSNAMEIKFKRTAALAYTDARYTGWYDVNKDFIRFFRLPDDEITEVSFTAEDIPQNACYFAVSMPTAVFNGFSITQLRSEKVYAASAVKAVSDIVDLSSISTGMFFGLTVDKLNFADLAGEGVSKYFRLATPIYKMADGSANPMNFKLSNLNYKFKICAFYKNENSYTLQYGSRWLNEYKLAPYIRTIDGKITPIEYFAVIFSDANVNRYMNTGDKIAICNSFQAYEEKSPGKYYRICSFNIARNWGAFETHASEDFTKWQIAQLLNILGNINPDILCMQEAVGNFGGFLDPERKYNLETSVFSDKFAFYSYFANTRQATKYIFGDYTNTVYTTQYETRQRQYTRAIVNIDGYKVAIFNTHTEYRGDYEEYLKPQMEELISAMNETMSSGAADYVIACGDFNSSSTSDFKVFEDAGYKLANCGPFGDKTTWGFINYSDPDDPVTNPEDPEGPKIPKVWNLSCLDNIIVSSNIKIQNVGVIPIYEASENKGGSWPIWYDDKPLAISDHYPLYCDISFN